MKSLYSKDGQDCDWLETGDVECRKLVIGSGQKYGDLNKFEVSCQFPSRFAEKFPNVEELILWGITNQITISSLPKNLKHLDIKECPNLSLPPVPESLEVLAVEDCPKVKLIGAAETVFANLIELFLKDAPFDPDWLIRVLASPHLQRAIVHGGDGVAKIESLSPSLRDLRLWHFRELTSLPAALPVNLTRLELPNSVSLIDLPSYQTLPGVMKLHGSGVPISPELLGDEPDHDAAPALEAFYQELENGYSWDHEVKVILIGNGRCGKTSLVNRLVENRFNRDEDSTHGIRLKRYRDVDFLPVDGPGTDEICQANLNIWDFAGQDLYHQTHRLFYHHKCVFVICESACPDNLGADSESDAAASEQAVKDKDKPKEIEYWLNQIAHLRNPPVIRVKTKIDRIDTDCELAQGEIGFSAKEGCGVDELNGALRIAVGKVLGRQGVRKVPQRLSALKQSIQIEYKDVNAKDHAAEKPPTHPKLTRTDFDGLVKEFLPDSLYSKKPSLALEFLDQSGFLYGDGKYLRDTVLLDLRWAIDAIYTALDRSGSWLRLEGRGRFTADQLRNWGWLDTEGEDRYKVEDRRLFINFMQEVGMIFELVPAWRSRDGATEYLLAQALPDRNEALAKKNPLATLKSDSEAQSFDVSHDKFVKLMARLVGTWGTSAILWKWGLLVKSFKEGESSWVELSFDEKQGKLSVVSYGDALELKNVILNGEDLEPFSGDDLERLPLEVGISFAGGEGREKWPLALATALEERGVTVEQYRKEQGRPRLEQSHGRKYLDAVVSKDFAFVFLSDKYLRSEYCCYELMKILGRLETEDYGLGDENAEILNAAAYSDFEINDPRKYIDIWNRMYKYYHLLASVDVVREQVEGDHLSEIEQAYDKVKPLLVDKYWDLTKAEIQQIDDFSSLIFKMTARGDAKVVHTLRKKNSFGDWLVWQDEAHENRDQMFKLVEAWRHCHPVDDNWVDDRKIEKWVDEIVGYLNKDKILFRYAKYAEEKGQRELALERYQKALEIKFGGAWKDRLAEIEVETKWEKDLLNALIVANKATPPES